MPAKEEGKRVEALEFAQQACDIEEDWTGDSTTWLPLLEAISGDGGPHKLLHG